MRLDGIDELARELARQREERDRPSDGATATGADGADGARVGILLSDVEPEHVEWLWWPRLPRAKVTLLEGDPDEGKSTLALDLAARVSTGAAMPLGCERGEPAGVVILSAEDGLGDTIRPRLEAADADLERILGFRLDELPEIPGGLAVIEAAIARVSAALVIVDPLAALLADRIEAHRDHHVRRALTPLASLAQRTGAAVLAIRHLNKSGGTHAKYRGGGSIGLTGAARSVMLAAPDPDDASGIRKVLARVKGNLGPDWPAVGYQLEAAGQSVRVRWIGTTPHTARELLALPEAEAERAPVDEAARYSARSSPRGQSRRTRLAGRPAPLASRIGRSIARAPGWACERVARDLGRAARGAGSCRLPIRIRQRGALMTGHRPPRSLSLIGGAL